MKWRYVSGPDLWVRKVRLSSRLRLPVELFRDREGHWVLVVDQAVWAQTPSEPLKNKRDARTWANGRLRLLFNNALEDV